MRRKCAARRPATPVTEGAAAGVLCLVPCFRVPGSGGKDKNTRMRRATRPPAVPMVEGDVEGGGGGDLTGVPLDGQTNRGSTPDDDER